MYEDEILLCIECAKDIRMKKLIQSINRVRLCTCCGNNDYVINVNCKEFIQMTKALIRYHYSEWDHNEHWGGDGYSSLFCKDDNIFLIEENFEFYKVIGKVFDANLIPYYYSTYHKKGLDLIH